MMVDQMIFGTEFPHCVVHPHFDSCIQFFFAKTLKVMKGLLQLNLPLHILPFLIFKLRTLRTEGVRPLLKLAKNIMRSVLFLTVYVQFANLAQYITKVPLLGRLCHRDGLLNVQVR